MTDNRTTELREKLDTLGIEHTDASYKRHIPITVWTVDGATFCYVEGFESTDLHIDNATPEQAIAATLGDDDYELKMDELLCRLTNGKWSKSRSYSVDFMVSCVDEAYEDATLGSEREKALEKLVQYALDEGHIDEWWYEDALKLGLEANY